MNRTFLVFIGSLLVIATGCAPKQMYYFGSYSETLYGNTKEMNDDSLLRHKQELENIIQQSKKGGTPIPPGICAELGYLDLKTSNQKEAIALFQEEERLYPESKVLMDRLLEKTNLEKQKNNSTANKTAEQGAQHEDI